MSDETGETKTADTEPAKKDRPIIVLVVAVINGGALVQSYASGGYKLAIASVIVSLIIIVIFQYPEHARKWISDHRRSVVASTILAVLFGCSVGAVAIARYINDARADRLWSGIYSVDYRWYHLSNCVEEQSVDSNSSEPKPRFDCSGEYLKTAERKIRAASVGDYDTEKDLIKAFDTDWPQTERAMAGVTEDQFLRACRGGKDDPEFKRIVSLNTKWFAYGPHGRTVQGWHNRSDGMRYMYTPGGCGPNETDFTTESCRPLSPPETERVCAMNWQRAGQSKKRLARIRAAVDYYKSHRSHSWVETTLLGGKPWIPADVFQLPASSN